MVFAAKNASLKMGEGMMDYIRFGTGPKVLIMLPGLGDGLRTVKGTVLPMALMYRQFAREFTVYAFSRKEPLPFGYSSRDMARDQAEAMDRLGISQADILGVSMGGMIAQHLAIDFPERIGKLVLAVTCAQPNEILEASVTEWVELAQKGDHAGFMRSNLLRIYSQDYCRRNMWMAPIVGRLTKPRSYDRFFTQAEACVTHNASADLGRIQARTLVIGGEQDKALGGDASRQIASAIPDAKLLMYPQWGHGLYEEAKDFNEAVYAFLTGRDV